MQHINVIPGMVFLIPRTKKRHMVLAKTTGKIMLKLIQQGDTCTFVIKLEMTWPDVKPNGNGELVNVSKNVYLSDIRDLNGDVFNYDAYKGLDIYVKSLKYEPVHRVLADDCFSCDITPVFKLRQ